MKKVKNYFPVNSLAPSEDGVTVFVKKVIGKKSDGFAVIENGKVYAIDVGKREDVELINFLLSLREKWLGDKALADGEKAKLELTLIVSHPHSDHMGALPLLLNDERFCVTDIYAPIRSQRSLAPSGELHYLINCENMLDSMCEELSEKGHTAKAITRVPFGKVYPLETASNDTVIELYPSHIDWSEDRPSDKEGYKYILAHNPETYKNMPETGYSNGILNGNSLWVKITKGEHSVLITGDQRASDEMLGAMIRYYGEEKFACDVLKIPHHGETNYSPHLISIASPRFTVFTTSLEKATPETVKLCEEMGCTNYYTADGDLFFYVTDKEVKAFGIEPR